MAEFTVFLAKVVSSPGVCFLMETEDASLSIPKPGLVSPEY